MAHLMQLEIVTPDKSLLNRDDVSYVLVETTIGGVGFLAHHAPLIGTLRESVLKFRDEKEVDHFLFVDGGFVEVKNNKVTVLCTAAEFAEDIDVEKAKRNMARAEASLANIEPTTDVNLVARNLRRAKARIKTAEQARKVGA